MYIPGDFRLTEYSELVAFMKRYSFGTLVTVHDGEPFASHLPFLVDHDRGASGVLRVHLARANPQWRDLAAGAPALVIFQGPHRYITPSWYIDEQNVPTWNYAVVHAYGAARQIEDMEETLALLRDLAQVNEAEFAEQWRFDPADEWIRSLVPGIVAFEIEITRLEGTVGKPQRQRSRHGRAYDARRMSVLASTDRQ
jgi:transcriptional regulator